MTKIVVITGSNSGIGKDTAIYYAKQGYSVIATMRNLDKAGELANTPNIKCFKMDVNDTVSVEKSVEEILKEYKKIDIIINNAGFGAFGPLEAQSEAEINNVFNTNVFGVVRVIKAFLPTLKAQNSGLILNISSIGGLVGMPLNASYCATKFALEGLSLSLGLELKQFNIKIKLIEPGAVSTNFIDALAFASNLAKYPEYNSTMDAVLKGFENSVKNGSTGLDVAESIFKASLDSDNAIHHVVGNGANALYNLKKSLSDVEFFNQLAKNFGL